jgi:hypothetical protein
MSFTLLDPQDFLEQGRTGVYSVDLFLSAVNPNKAQKKSKTFNVDFVMNVEKKIPSITSTFNTTVVLSVQEVRQRSATGAGQVISASKASKTDEPMQAPSPFYVPSV